MNRQRTTISLTLALLLTAGVVWGQQDGGDSTKSPAQPETTAVTSAEPQSSLSADAVLCTGVVDRMPQGEDSSFTADVGTVYLWCRIKGAKDSTYVIHRWLYQGREMAAVELAVKSGSWRTWSSKKILPEWTGKWEVEIVDAHQQVLKTVRFRVE